MEPGELIRSVEPWSVLAQPLDPESMLLAGAWQAAVTGKGWTDEYGDAGERDELLEWLVSWRPESFKLAHYKRAFDL